MRIIKLEEIPEIQIAIPDLNKTGCPVGCSEEGKYLRCYFGLHYLCSKLKNTSAQYVLKREVKQ